MRILKLAPGKHPKEMEITDSLESMQSIVSGMIQAVYPFEDTVALICNEEGKLLDLPYNRALRTPDTNQIYDIICGTCFLCGASENSDTFTSLTKEQLERYKEYYWKPELFLKVNGNIVVLKL